MPTDPFTYVGRVIRDSNGKPVNMELFSEGDTIHISEGDEFVTFTTVVQL